MYRRLCNLLTYPILMSVACVVMMVLLENMVVSSFRDVFRDFDADLPAATEAATVVSSGVAYFFAGAIAAVLAVGLLLLPGTGAAFKRRAAYRVPHLGAVMVIRQCCRNARGKWRACSYVMPCRCPTRSCFRFARPATPDYVAPSGRSCTTGGRQSLGPTHRGSENLPAGFAQTVIWGEDRTASSPTRWGARRERVFEARGKRH